MKALIENETPFPYQGLRFLVEVVGKKEGHAFLWMRLQGEADVQNRIPLAEIIFRQWAPYGIGAILETPAGWGLDNDGRSLCTVENASQMGRCVALIQQAWMEGRIEYEGKSYVRSQGGTWVEEWIEEEVDEISAVLRRHKQFTFLLL